MVKRITLLVVISLWIFCLPVQAATSIEVAKTIASLKQTEKQALGAKRLAPILDLFGEEVVSMGTRLSDNVVYSMERLWQDTVTWNINKKSKI